MAILRLFIRCQRETNKRANEMDELRNSNRTLSSQVFVLRYLLGCHVRLT